MEEQCCITQQIRYTNQTHRTARGLSQVTMVTPTSTKVQHTNQNDIEIACLNEAHARFTQANDMPCMIEPIYNELHWLSTHLPAFDQITARMYIPLDRTSTSAQLLFPLMQQPLEVTDQPTTLSTTAHKTGWLKAKDSTASSKSGAHCPLWALQNRSPPLWHQWDAHTPSGCPTLVWVFIPAMEKRDQYCAQKVKGNFDMEKLRIILLFKVDFNQHNKFISKEMMHQAKGAALVTGEQYGSRNGKSASTQSLNKWLAFDIIHQTRQAAIICSNDAKSCYDCIIHCIAAQCMYQCGVSKLALVCMFTTLQNLHHHIQTLYRDSEIWAALTSGECQSPALGRAMEPAHKYGQLWAPPSSISCAKKDLVQHSKPA